MAKDWVSFFDTWAQPPSATEVEERDRTQKQINAALDSWPAVAKRNLTVYAKGSYRRGTNVRRGSDVDIAVELRGHESGHESFTFARHFQAEGLSKSDLGIIDAPADYRSAKATLKEDCFDALVNAFGRENVIRHNKCITVSEKSTTLPADVVPCTTYRRYDSRTVVHEGIKIVPDRGSEIINWPQHDYDNGVSKNTSTNRRFKRTVRGIKALENLMADAGYPEVASWLIECLVYNAPTSEFGSTSNYENALRVVQWVGRELGSTNGRGDWVEVNDLKWLFAPSQSWSISEATSFVSSASAYMAT